MNFDFSGIKALLIGDFMLDHYIEGISNRLSPEAPVPVVEPTREHSMAGGAGNVALNICALGARVDCLGQVGNDKWGKKLVSILNNHGANTENIKLSENIPTTVKERIFLDGKQQIRIDRDSINNQFSINNYLKTDFSKYDICIFSDYNKGTVNNIDISYPNLSTAPKILVDPKKSDFTAYKGADFITPNFNELKNVSIINDLKDNEESIIDACRKIIDTYNIAAIVAKRGDKGMIVVEKNDDVCIIPAHKVKKVDVTGAGDTVIAAFALAISKTENIIDAAKFANAAAAVIVQKFGTQTANVKEIESLLPK